MTNNNVRNIYGSLWVGFHVSIEVLCGLSLHIQGLFLSRILWVKEQLFEAKNALSSIVKSDFLKHF